MWSAGTWGWLELPRPAVPLSMKKDASRLALAPSGSLYNRPVTRMGARGVKSAATTRRGLRPCLLALGSLWLGAGSSVDAGTLARDLHAFIDTNAFPTRGD